jgi:hypothetical protein
LSLAAGLYVQWVKWRQFAPARYREGLVRE